MHLFETEFWNIELSPDQAYLGRCRISLKRNCGHLSELTPHEWSEFHEHIVKVLENAFTKAFGATMFNWTCLMNNAYKNTPPTPHIHWHFRPRYQSDVTFSDMVFQDTEFANHYDRARKNNVPTDVLLRIKGELEKYL